MIQVRPARDAGTQAAYRAHRDRHRARGGAGVGHLRADRLDLVGVRLDLQRELQEHRRGHHRQVGLRAQPGPRGCRAAVRRVSAADSAGASRGRGGWRRGIRRGTADRPGRQGDRVRRGAEPRLQRRPSCRSSTRCPGRRRLAGRRRGRDRHPDRCREGLQGGDTIGVQARGPIQRMRISGLVEFGAVSSIGGATLAGFDIPTAQELFDKEGKLDQILLSRKDGVSEQQLLNSVRTVLRRGHPGTQRRGPGRGGCRGYVGLPRLLPYLPAGLRRGRAVRRVVRDRELAVDHDRPAHPRVRHPADAGRVPAPAARHGGAGGVGHRAAGIRGRVVPRARHRHRAVQTSSTRSG